jgi:sulfur-oxidizing protein SoxZ
MADPMRVRALARNGGVDLRVLMAHGMAGGAEPHFIRHVNATGGGRIVLGVQRGPAVAKNPVLRFTGGRKGDAIEVTWTEGRGARRSDRARAE